MDTPRVGAGAQVVVDVFGQVRGEGGEHGAESAHDIIHRLVGLHFLHCILFEPHPLPDELDIPARDILKDGRKDRTGGLVQHPFGYGAGDRSCHAVDAGDDPPVLFRHRGEMFCHILAVPDTIGAGLRGKPVEDHVGQREPVHVPEDIDRTVGGAHPLPVELQVVPWRACGEHIETKDIDAHLCDHLFRGDHIAE